MQVNLLCSKLKPFCHKKLTFFSLSFTASWKGEIHCFHECHARAAHSPGAFIITELLEGHYYPLCVWQNLSSELVHSDSVTFPALHKFLCHNKALSLGHPRLSVWKNQQFKDSSVQTNQLLKTPNSLLNCFLGLPKVCSYHMTPWIKLRMILNKDQVY